jgi:hypothetical protein
MAGPPPTGPGIAEDASDYQDFPEGEARPRARAGGAGDDAKLFEDLVEPAPEDALTLDAAWLYKVNGQNFGPVSSKVLLDKLYAGELDAESLIAPEEAEFMQLRRYGAFRVHLPKATEHRAATEEARRREQEVRRSHARRWLVIGLLSFGGLGGGGWLVWTSVQKARVERAERDKAEQEAKLKLEYENLMANLTIEPPLVDLVDEEDEPDPTTPGARRKRSGSKRPAARPGSDLPPTVLLQRSEIMSGVNEVFGGLKRCIVEQIQRDPDTIGERIELSFAVNNAGVVQDFDINDRALRKSPMKDCMAGKMAQLKFRKYIGEVQNIESYPITIGGRR